MLTPDFVFHLTSFDYHSNELGNVDLTIRSISDQCYD